MRFFTQPALVAITAFFLNWLFFFEYLPPVFRTFLPYDLEGYHYPLMDFAFRVVRAGHLPEWDPSLYCGLPLAGNLQAALFYPPTWLLFAVSLLKTRLPYEHLQVFVLLHVWLAFTLAFAWLRGRRLGVVACWVGAAVFAYSGYMMTQLQHLGLAAGFAWWPLAFAGVDEAAERRDWRPLWKLAVASAMVFLAGYPPFWAAFAICAGAYALGLWPGWRVLAAALGAMFFSLALAAVQLLPSLEVSRLMTRNAAYGLGVRDPATYYTYAMPNYFRFGLEVDRQTSPGFDYWYLGAAGLAGVLLTLVSATDGRLRRASASGWLVVGATLVFLTNPLHAISSALEYQSLLGSVLRSWYFMAGLTAGSALLAAVGLDRALDGRGRRLPAWCAWTAVAAALGWVVRLLVVWWPDATDFAYGESAWVDPAAGLLLVSLLLLMYRGSAEPTKRVIAVTLVVLAFAEFKAFGTSRRFNGSRDVPLASIAKTVPGVDEGVYQKMLADREYRVAVSEDGGPTPGPLRHHLLATPQGFEPVLPAAFHRLAEQSGARFTSDRIFALDPAAVEGLRLLGVKYFIAPEQSLEYPKLKADGARFRFAGTEGSYFKVFEMVDPRPAFGWSNGSVRVVAWEHARREFEVDGVRGGTLRLSEQFYPGWTATIDGAAASISACHEALQCVQVPPGKHRLEFKFRSMTLRWGAAISAIAVLLLVAAVRTKGRGQWRPARGTG